MSVATPASKLDKLRRVLPGLWAGALLAVAGLATPAPFATLAQADAGRVVARVLMHEAYLGLALGASLLVLERLAARQQVAQGGSQFSTGMVLALAALFCTVAGYFGLQPLMAAARAGQGSLSFGQLHAISAGFFGLKLILVLSLAWRAARHGPARA